MVSRKIEVKATRVETYPEHCQLDEGLLPPPRTPLMIPETIPKVGSRASRWFDETWAVLANTQVVAPMIKAIAKSFILPITRERRV